MNQFTAEARLLIGVYVRTHSHGPPHTASGTTSHHQSKMNPECWARNLHAVCTWAAHLLIPARNGKSSSWLAASVRVCGKKTTGVHVVIDIQPLCIISSYTGAARRSVLSVRRSSYHPPSASIRIISSSSTYDCSQMAL